MPDTTRPTYGPYSPLRQASGMWYASGQIGVDPASGTASPLTEAQARQALLNLRAVLGSAGLGMEDVVKTTVFLTDMADFTAINQVYEQAFAACAVKPARSCVAVRELPRVAGDVILKFEIEAVAYRAEEVSA